MPEKCGTCPFREGSPYAFLADDLAKSALTEKSRICHSTGNSVFYGRTGKKSMICRGARDKQLEYLAAIGFLSAPTDEAWAAKCQEMNL